MNVFILRESVLIFCFWYSNKWVSNKFQQVVKPFFIHKWFILLVFRKHWHTQAYEQLILILLLQNVDDSYLHADIGKNNNDIRGYDRSYNIYISYIYRYWHHVYVTSGHGSSIVMSVGIPRVHTLLQIIYHCNDAHGLNNHINVSTIRTYSRCQLLYWELIVRTSSRLEHSI